MARPPAKRSRSPLTPLYAILGIVALVGIGVIAYQFFAQDQPTTAPVAVNIDPAELQRTPGISIGREDAPVVIYEFADFQCPACSDFAAFYSPLIKERLVEPGLARYVYYDFPLSIHQHAFLAARAGRCANEQEMFWPYHDILYGRQPTWAASADPTELFVELAGEVGLDERSFEACLRSDRYAEEVTRSLRLGESLNVRGTPTLFVNMRQIQIPRTFEQLEQLVREEAGVAQNAPVTGTTAPAAGAAGTGAATPGS